MPSTEHRSSLRNGDQKPLAVDVWSSLFDEEGNSMKGVNGSLILRKNPHRKPFTLPPPPLSKKKVDIPKTSEEKFSFSNALALEEDALALVDAKNSGLINLLIPSIPIFFISILSKFLASKFLALKVS